MPIRIVLADDHPSYRRVVKELIEQEADLLVVAEAQDGADAVTVAALTRPDVVVLDVAMPRMDGMEAARRILAADPAVRVLALSLHYEACYVDGMLGAGACGYVLKQDAFTDLAAAIRAAAQGRQFVSPALGARTARDAQRPVLG